MTDALQYGILSLLLILLAVVGLFARFFLSCQKRIKQLS